MYATADLLTIKTCRLRVSYYVGNSPVSTMFSYELLSDGRYHKVELLAISKNFTLRVDGGIARSIINEGDNEFLVLHSSLFVGGVEPKLGEEVLKKWHLRNATSFNGMTIFFLILPKHSPKMLIFVRLFERGLRQQQIS